ncbi:MAG: hypothetical protein OXH53_06325 [bacterium]|nr:hypothetical protein [bacterium]
MAGVVIVEVLARWAGVVCVAGVVAVEVLARWAGVVCVAVASAEVARVGVLA